MDKLTMMSKDKVQENIEKIQKLFPNAVTEVLRDGKPTLARNEQHFSRRT